jgi:K+-sensing histidine kinase KdpD
MIQAARATAAKFHAEMIVAYVRQPNLTPADSATLEAKLAYAKSVGSPVAILDGGDPVNSILDFAQARGVTQLFIGHTQTLKRWPWIDPVDKLIRRSKGMDVRIFPQ